MPDVRLRAIVSGRVQGVGFRYFVVHGAEQLGLRGYVRNLAQQVEVVAEGERPRLEALVRLLRQGPPAARVDNVQTSFPQATGEFRGFQVRGSSY